MTWHFGVKFDQWKEATDHWHGQKTVAVLTENEEAKETRMADGKNEISRRCSDKG